MERRLFFVLLNEIIIILCFFSKTVDCQCGQPAYLPQLEGGRVRVVNGNTAVPHSWPWAVRITYKDNFAAFACGGALVGLAQTPGQSDIVVTAAHCVLNVFGKRLDPRGFTVRLGDHNVNEQEIAEVSTGVSKYVYHARYEQINNDLAILKLNEPIKFNKYIQPICLPTQNQQPFDRNTCYAVGWGRVSDHTDATARVLQQVRLPVLTNQECQSAWGQIFNVNTTLCAGYMNGSKSLCYGDSGSPLVCKEKGERWTLFGSFSFGNASPCAMVNKPGLFARISSYRYWIEQQINQLRF